MKRGISMRYLDFDWEADIEQEFADFFREMLADFRNIRLAEIIPALGLAVAGFAMYCGLWLIF